MFTRTTMLALAATAMLAAAALCMMAMEEKPLAGPATPVEMAE